MTAIRPKTLTEAPADAATRDLPYGLHTIDDDDVAAVAEAVRAPLLASGPRVAAFEKQFCERTGAADAIACSSGTAALQLALFSLNLKPGDVCLAPPISFLATATAVLLCGAEVVFVDVDAETGLMDPQALTATLEATPEVRAVLPVHLGGRLCDVAELGRVTREAGAVMIEDCCHATGGVYEDGVHIGAGPHSVASTFSFHPVKMMTTGEGGMVTTNDPERGARLRRLRNHGVTRDPSQLTEEHSFDEEGLVNPWTYEHDGLGHNFRMSEMQGALGASQLKKLDRFVGRRQMLADHYAVRLAPYADIIRPTVRPNMRGLGLHLYSVNIDFEALGTTRARVMRKLLEHRIGAQVHYIPIYRQPFFKNRYGEMRLAGAEAYYSRTLTLPLFPGMTFDDADRVVVGLIEALGLR